jgi:curved DNA-binding protein CbpA
MPTGNPYKILGVEPNASPEAIRKAYRTLVKKYHPDKNPNQAAAAKFIEIQAAYEQITNGEVGLQPDAVQQKYRASQQQYEQELEAYMQQRAAAREKIRQQKLKEEAYKINYLQQLKSGKTGLWHQAVAYVGLLLFFAVWVDYFLPSKQVPIQAQAYGIQTYGSMDDHLVQLFTEKQRFN